MSSWSAPAKDFAPLSRQGWYGRLEERVGANSGAIAAVILAAGFCWRVWLAHATFFNTDEAWHYSVANKDSLLAVYKASLTLAHPPLLVVILYFWKHFGTSDVMLRFPGVLAGTAFCWVFYKWLTRLLGKTPALVGLIFAALLPPMIALTAELRQYSFLLLFAALSGYCLDSTLDQNSVRMMIASSSSLYLAMLSHYSAFLFAAVLGFYAIVRIAVRRPANGVMATWAAGQIVGVALAGFLYKTHISKLGSVYPGDPLHRFGDFYLADWYFHPGRGSLIWFLWRSTLGVFRFTFGQTALGQIAALFFLAGLVLLIRAKPASDGARPSWLTPVLLATPFVLSWLAAVAGFYPYGRTRQCAFLAIFALAGVSVALSRVAGYRPAWSATLALLVVAACHAFGTLQGRDMLPLPEQRREHMDAALRFLHRHAQPTDVILTDKATSYQLQHYLCEQRSAPDAPEKAGLERFRCDGFHIVSTDAAAGALTADTVATLRWDDLLRFNVNRVWVVQGGWASGLGETMRSQVPQFGQIEIESFGRYLEIFQMPSVQPYVPCCAVPRPKR